MKVTSAEKSERSRQSRRAIGQPAAPGFLSAPSTRSKPRAPARILLADDDPAVRESLANALRSEGYEVVLAPDGQQALCIQMETNIDLVLLDLNMPVKGGWDTFERLTAEQPLLPIIIITGRPSQLFTAVAAGAGALLEKPLDIQLLLETVKSLLAEPAEARLKRMTGRSSEFIYQPQRSLASKPET